MSYDIAAGWNEIGPNTPPRPGTRPPRPVDTAAVAMAESNRIEKRSRLKRAIAESQIAESRWQEIGEVIAKLEARKEQLAAEHVAACSPIQRELTLLRENQVTRILAGNDDDDDESRRIELQDKIAELNATLEKQIADADASLMPLHREHLANARQIDPTLKSDLVQSASAENRIKMMVLSARCQFLRRRFDGLSEALRERRQDLLLQHLLADAELMLSEANKLSSDAVDACVNE